MIVANYRIWISESDTLMLYQVNKYYDLSTSFYEYGWGESFHFAHRWRLLPNEQIIDLLFSRKNIPFFLLWEKDENINLSMT
jgi:hypothetical protein